MGVMLLGKLKVHELAKELGINCTDIVSALSEEKGIEAVSVCSVYDKKRKAEGIKIEWMHDGKKYETREFIKQRIVNGDF